MRNDRHVHLDEVWQVSALVKDQSSKVLILAAGDGVRWDNYDGIPKHLVTIEDEVLLERTCRQFLQYTDDVVVVGPDDRYTVNGTTLFIPSMNEGRELEKFASSMELWSDNRTVLVFGDVYFTDDAVKTIMTCGDSWTFYCRKGPSQITGKKYKEIFALSFLGEKKDWIKENVMSIIDMKNVVGGWTLFRLLSSGRKDSHIDEQIFTQGHSIEIDDWTEDFDFPKDLEAWKENRPS